MNKQANSRPNFIFFITDQQRGDHLGCYGNPLLRTPHIDALAARGWLFERFYVASAMCMPNRATIMTGRMPTLHGVRQNGIPLSLDSTCFTHLLQEVGYRTGLFGKSHLQNFTGDVPKFQLKIPEGLTPPPDRLREVMQGLRLGAAYDRELASEKSTDPAADEREGPFYGFERFRFCTWPAPGYSAPQLRWSRIPEELYPTNYVADTTIEFLEERARDPQAAPFFVQCSFPDPHHPFTPPGKYFHLYNPDEVRLPASFHHRPHDQTPMLKRMHEDLAAGRAQRETVAPYAVTESEAKQITAATYGMLTLIDDAVGRVMAKLRELGLAENTVVIFTSDHGDWMGDHGVMQKGPLHYQGLIRVPFIWSDPQDASAGKSAGKRTDALAGSIDIARSILHRAGVAPANGMQGRDLNRIMQQNEGSTHDCIVVEQQTSRPYLGMSEQVRVRTMTDGRWRMSLWDGLPSGELYDLEGDPGEIVNLWGSPAHLGARRELMERMLWKMVELQDRSPFPVGEA